MDRYDNFTIYFAELKHLAKWGQRITADDVSEDASNIMLPQNKSHDKIWLKNYREGKGKKVIATMDLAESAHASEVRGNDNMPPIPRFGMLKLFV